MLAETVKRWQEQALQEGLREGLQKGLQEGRQQEAAKLFSLLLESKFGTVSQLLEDKVRNASPEQIEAWTKQIFQAKTPDELLNS
jgi:flagellar biosynthesis/type III secretory pathway protein FliH